MCKYHAFNRATSRIIVEEMTETEIEEINKKLGTAKIFKDSKAVSKISSAHIMQLKNGKIVVNETSKLGYN